MIIEIKLTPAVRKLKAILPPEALAEFERCLDQLERTTRLAGEIDLPKPRHTCFLHPQVGFLILYRHEKRGIRGKRLRVIVKRLVPAAKMDAFLQLLGLLLCDSRSEDELSLVPEAAIAILDNTSRLDLARKLVMVILTVTILALTSIGTRVKWNFVLPSQNEPPKTRVN